MRLFSVLPDSETSQLLIPIGRRQHKRPCGCLYASAYMSVMTTYVVSCIYILAWAAELLILIGGQCEVPESKMSGNTDSHVLFIWNFSQIRGGYRSYTIMKHLVSFIVLFFSLMLCLVASMSFVSCSDNGGGDGPSQPPQIGEIEDPTDNPKYPKAQPVDMGLSVCWASWNMGEESEFGTNRLFG